MKIFVGYFPFRLFPQHFHFDSMEYGRWHRKMFDDGIVPANIVFYQGGEGTGSRWGGAGGELGMAIHRLHDVTSTLGY